MTINKNGVLMNIGAHALYKGGEAKKIFDELEITIKGNEPSTDAHVGRFSLVRKRLFHMPYTLRD